jgi:hypothetical protein
MLTVLPKGTVVRDKLNGYLDGIPNTKLSLQNDRIVTGD